jgi:hypothetical protein
LRGTISKSGRSIEAGGALSGAIAPAEIATSATR